MAPRTFSPKSNNIRESKLKPWSKELVNWATEIAFENREEKVDDKVAVWNELKERLAEKKTTLHTNIQKDN